MFFTRNCITELQLRHLLAAAPVSKFAGKTSEQKAERSAQFRGQLFQEIYSQEPLNLIDAKLMNCRFCIEQTLDIAHRKQTK